MHTRDTFININCYQMGDLTHEQCRQWRALASSRAGYDSPFLDPEFASLLGAVRPHVRVLVAEDSEGLAAVLPCEVHGPIAKPLGVKLADFQGLVARNGVEIDPAQLLRHAGLNSWVFDHRIADKSSPLPATTISTGSPYIDLSEGFEAYCDRRARAGSQTIKQARRKLRKLAREQGEIQIEHDVCNAEAFAQLIQWKQAQRIRTGTFDVTQYEWVREFLNHLARHHSPQLRGVLSTMHCGDRLIAAHFGVTTPSTLHYWFPAYDAKFQRYSPGMGLLLSLAEYAAAQGHARLDLGKGDERYKQSFATGEIPIDAGTLSLNPARAWMGSFATHGRRWLKNSPFYEHLKRPKRWLQGRRHREAMNAR